MLSIIIFLIGCAVTITTSLLVFLNSMKWWAIVQVAISSILWMIVVNGIVACISCKILPKKWFETENKFYNPTKKECKFYEKLGIKKWKDLNADLGQLNGFKKDKIDNNPENIKRFIIECRKGFLDHFISLFVSVLAIFILPVKYWVPTGIPIAITAFILNLLPVMILRYNIPRLKTLLKFSERKKDA